MKRKVASLLMVMVLALGMVACTSSGGESSTTSEETTDKADASASTEKKEDINVYWIGKTLNNPWWISVSDFAQQEADALGVNLTIAIPQEEVDLEKQVAMIETAIEKNADAIVISAASSDGVVPAIKKAREQGIKIVNFDTRISDKSVIDAFVGGDDEAGAYKAGKYICEQLGGEGEVAIITGLMAQSTGVDRHAGFMRACEEYTGIKVVAEQSAEWSSDKAADVTTNILTANPNVKAIFACNDQMAVGMVNAAKSAGKSADDLVLVGFDGILDAVDLVLAGDLDAFVSLPNLDEGAMGVKLASALVMNSEYVYDREIIYDCTLVTDGYIDGLTDQTIYEFAAERFPLRGVTENGY
ncbi:sugar ABC transporter substrate-binding protein [Ohessyouella blattaphilus]|uniref:Sugar ABC transporter substrate-binding protein n=1 Tax=Ohessyouella blattaphilus TaxID=2949333 RepID=A0ABT1EJA6_9FIRM|nr:sugar ABC transporter substrate-binding protein [Ohessyouella blattaphilus]MCP1110786.1 sugar ABC transporter substrate-binding protein [Ohessyouella blattaphilus]MCR8564180.1 sugar ABC transporter substrate-binding protein [Ohessyouella blattaphilus]